jgi:DNA polymerase-3 subunit epsilon
LKRKLIAVFLFLCSFSSLSLLFEERNFIYLILAVAFAFGGIKLFKKQKTTKPLAKATPTDKTKIQPIKESEITEKSNFIEENKEIETIDADFIAIDFETANNNNNSACSMGLVVVKDLEIIESKYFLIQPPVMSFDDVNIKIHGIMAKDVKDKPKFPEIWNEIKHYFINNIIIAHNAQFDMSVLKSLQLEYNLNIPDFVYMDSMYISSKACGSDIRKTLSARAEALGVELTNHHNALDDTIACANIIIETVKKCRKKSFQSFINVYTSLNKKKFSELKHQQYFKKGRTFDNVKISEIETCTTADCNNPFYGKNIVFTGELSKYGRKEAMQLVADFGGVVKSGVSGKTDYLIVGKQDESIVGDDGLSRKEEKAYELIENGKDIQIIDEDEFYDMIDKIQQEAYNL